MTSLFDLTAKVAVVTGSSRGIGEAAAMRLAEHGARVVVSSRSVDGCGPVAERIRQRGGEAIAEPCHIGRRDDLERLVATVTDQYGGVDVLVANAAINPYLGNILGLTDEVFDKLMTANVRSLLTLSRLVVPQMARRGGGSLIVISSIGGLRASPGLGGYGMTKAADIALVRSIAVEWGAHNVRANCIAPGLVKTEFARALWEDPGLREARERDTPLRRIGEPDEIAGAVVFLASAASSFMTGQTIVIDGGVTAGPAGSPPPLDS